MKLFQLPEADGGDLRLVRIFAITLIGAIAITALHFGQDVLIPAAVAIFFAFILGPLVTWVRRLLPLPLAVATVVLGAVIIVGLLAVLTMTEVAKVAGSLTSYQTNLHAKIHDIRSLSEGGGAVSRFLSMMAGLTHDFAPGGAPAALPASPLPANASSFSNVAAFVSPLLHPVLTIGIVVILVVFILLDRDHLSDQFVRLFGASDVHATSEALNDAAARIARALSLQLLTNVGFGLMVSGGLFILGMPNALLWGLLAGALRFIPYVGAALGAVLPTLIAFAIMPGWLRPLLVLGCVVGLDIVIGQIVEPLLFGESTGVTPLALILSAIFWGTMWGPMGLLLATPLTICLLVLGKHVPHLGFLEVLLGDEPALTPAQQIYRRLIRKAVADASAVALAEIEAKGPHQGLDDGMGRMIVLADTDRTLDRLTAGQVDAIVTGTREVLDFLTDSARTGEAVAPPDDAAATAPRVIFRCVSGRGQIDDAAAAIVAFALHRDGIDAATVDRQTEPSEDDGAITVHLICYASHPSDAVRRYIARKLRSGHAGPTRHVVIDYEVAAAPLVPLAGLQGATDVLVGDIGTICRLAAQFATTIRSAASADPPDQADRIGQQSR